MVNARTELDGGAFSYHSARYKGERDDYDLCDCSIGFNGGPVPDSAFAIARAFHHDDN